MNSSYVEAELVCHRDTPARATQGIRVGVGRNLDDLYVKYWIFCDTASIRVPPPAKPERTDGLWQTTCCEMFTQNIFMQHEGVAYEEFNFAPSGQWAAYEFTAYREGMAPMSLHEPPRILFCDEKDDSYLYMSVTMPQPRVQPAMQIGLSVVIEELDGTKSYWALAHPPGKPDFHHPDCFALTLPAIGDS